MSGWPASCSTSKKKGIASAFYLLRRVKCFEFNRLENLNTVAKQPMPNDLLYLRSNVMVEPLLDGWYAWAHLIPPATAARNLTERHLKIMDSYIDSPETHASA